MVDGFTKDGTFRPIRSPIAPPQNLTVRELLPQGQTKEEEKMQSERRREFAKEKINEQRKKEQKEKQESLKERLEKKKLVKGARVAGKGLKATGSLLRFGSEKFKQRGIEKSIREREFTEKLDKGIDTIVDDPNTTDASKLRLLIRFARLNRRNFTKEQRNEISAINRELIARVKESRKAFVSNPQGVGIGSGVSEEQLAKLPQPVRSEIEQAVA